MALVQANQSRGLAVSLLRVLAERNPVPKVAVDSAGWSVMLGDGDALMVAGMAMDSSRAGTGVPLREDDQTLARTSRQPGEVRVRAALWERGNAFRRRILGRCQGSTRSIRRRTAGRGAIAVGRRRGGARRGGR